MLLKQFLITCLLCVASQALASSDDRFIKKYAMMKIYESCFGPEVVKQLRKEMRDAYAKCSSPPPSESPSIDSYWNSLTQTVKKVTESATPPMDHPVKNLYWDPITQSVKRVVDGAAHNQDNEQPNQDRPIPPPQKQPPSLGDILAFRPNGQGPIPQQPSIPPYMMPGTPQLRPFSAPNPFYQYPYNPMLYPPGVQYNPYAYQQYQQAFYQQQQPYFASNRMSGNGKSGPRRHRLHRSLDDQQESSHYQPIAKRQIDYRDRLDHVFKAAEKVRNITCVMLELGYIDNSLEPNYEQITQRINNLPVATELKTDIQEGLQFCQKFSQCVPEVKRDMAPLSQELIKPMFFFRCYKHKKLEACITKDIRERFAVEDDLDTDTDFRSLSRSARSVSDDPVNDPRYEALDEMAIYLYDYLSGGNGFDFDMYV